MAIVGVRNVSVLDSSFFRESHSQSSRRRGDGGRVGSTRSSSLLQMWQDIEDEHAVSQAQGTPGDLLLEQRTGDLGDNESDTWSHSQSQSQNGDNSPDLGQVERERVRQIFKEWMNSGAGDNASNISGRNNSPRAEWLGETEQERVRIIREWVQMSSQQRGVSSGESREEHSTEIDTQIERVLDGLVVNKNEGRMEHTRRGIRKLCGRQVLLDMLKKAESERQREVRELLDHHAVSHFPHRNRIQALLRGRFLRNDRASDNNRSTSVAEGELGLLRQKQTVSGLREGFFSRKAISGCSLVTSSSTDTSSNSDIDGYTNQQTEASSSQMVPNTQSELSEPNLKVTDRLEISSGQNPLRGPLLEKSDWQDSSAHIEEQKLQLLEMGLRDLQSSPSVTIERRDRTGQSVDVMSTEDTATGLTQPGFQIEDTTEHCRLQNFSEEQSEQSVLSGIINVENALSNNSNYLERNVVDDAVWNESAASEGVQQVGFANDDGENSNLQELPELRQEHGSYQEAVESWLGASSYHEGAFVGRTHGIYFPDDDNDELRELLSRRRVSNLLSSSFRENLDRLLQSYVERQGRAEIEWELQEITPDSVQEDLERQAWDQIGEESAADTALVLPSSPTPSQLRHDNWPQNDMNNQYNGNEWDIINGLRIDITVLQQRMNSMQRMLEACMDLQLELQRSIRQEVSSAIDPSAGSSRSGLQDLDSPEDKSKWECVRNGLCCICCENNIDSLLYRCGHMCACLKCANELFESKRKCPMCGAPVVEVIHAYSIL